MYRRFSRNNAQWKSLIYVAVGLLLSAGLLLSYGATMFFFQQGWVSIAGNVEQYFQTWYFVSIFVVTAALIFMVFALFIISKRETEASRSISWLQKANVLLDDIVYPLGADGLRSFSESVASLFPGNLGWVMIVQAPGLLMSGEFSRRRFIELRSNYISGDWNLGYVESFLRIQMKSQIHSFGDVIPVEGDNGRQSHVLVWMKRPDGGDLATGIGIALNRRQRYLLTDRVFLADVLDNALDMVINRLAILFTEVLHRRDAMGNEGLGLMYRILSHEVAGELQVAFNSLTGLNDDLAQGKPEQETQRRITSLVSSMWRSSHWVDLMRDMPMIGDSVIPIKPDALDLGEVLYSVFHIAGDAWPEVSFDIQWEAPHEKLIVRADTHLNSILRNVIYNAAGFSPVDGVVTVTVGVERKFAIINVEDEGDGVPRDMVDAVFDPLKGSAVRTNGKKGMGVGLFVSRIIARAYGGDIQCIPPASDETGALFSIKIPLG